MANVFRRTPSGRLSAGDLVRKPLGSTAATVATGFFEAASEVDPLYARNLLLLQDRLADNSPLGRTVTASGGAAVSSVQSKFGGASLAFPGSSKLTVASTPAFEIGTGDFTFETWIYVSAWTFTFADFASVFNVGTYTTGMQSRITPSALEFYIGGSSYIASTSGTVTTGQWHHIAAVRKSGVLTQYWNGVQQGGTFTCGDALRAGDLTLGMAADNPSEYLQGYLDDVRVSTVARYSAAFTPPTQAFYSPALIASESGVDTFAATGTVTTAGSGVTGTLAATESGADTFASTGKVIVKGSLAVSETGSDTLASTGKVIVKGALAVSESGADTLSASGKVIVKGGLAVSETGADTLSAAGKVVVKGALAAAEAGADSFAATGSLSGVGVSGVMAATEGSDTLAATGSLSATFTLSGTQAQLVRRLHALHGLASPLVVGASSRRAGDVVQSVTEAGGTVTVATTAGSDTFAGSVGQMIEELAALHGLTTSLVVTASQRTAGAIVQTITTAGSTTTVARQ